jgi:putative peptidoglycan lipid II flippase
MISVIIFPVLLFRAFVTLFQSFFYSYNKPYIATTGPIIISITVILFIFLPYIKGSLLYNISYGFLFGNIILVIYYFITYLNQGGKVNVFKFKIDALTKNVLKGSISILFLVLINQIYFFSKNFFASYFGEGAISSLNYSSSITSLIPALIFSSVFSVLLSKLSELSSFGNRAKVKKLYLNSFLGLIFVILPVVILFEIYSREILSIVYLRGQFTISAIGKTDLPFLWDALSMLSFIIYIIPTAFYLAKKQYKILTIIGISVYIPGILLNYLFSLWMGFEGIAFTNFIIGAIHGLILLFYSRKFIGKVNLLIKDLLLMVISGAIVFAIIYGLKVLIFTNYINYDFTNLIIIVIINFLTCVILYSLITYILKVNYIHNLRTLFNTRKY